MKPRLKSTEAARDLIKRFEPFLPVAERGADGRFVVGYGHQASARDGVTVDEANADLLLIYDVLQAERAIDETIATEMGAPQRDALVSFGLGVGLGAFRQSATVRLIAKHRWRDAAEAIAAWGGGQSPRRAAERELFLTDLPEDADQRPVELVIEFEHGDSDAAEEPTPAVVGSPEAEAGPVVLPVEPELTTSDVEAPEADDTPGSIDTADVDDAAVEDIAPDTDGVADAPDDAAQSFVLHAGQDSVTARVIARMREQIAPRRQATAVDIDASVEPELSVEENTDETGSGEEDAPILIASFDPVLIPEDLDDEAADIAAAEVTEAPGSVGFVFASDSVMDVAPDALTADVPETTGDNAVSGPEAEAEDANSDVEELPDAVANDTDVPPMMSGDRPAQALGATGEAGGLDAANDPSENIDEGQEDDLHPVHAQDLPDPHEIDPSVADMQVEDHPRNHWQNGDSSAAPAPSSGRWGTIAVFAVGLSVLIAGIVDTVMKADYYWESKSLLFGPAAAIIGGLLFSGAAIMLISRLFAPKEVERKTGPMS